MAQWELFRDLLADLYLLKKLTLSEIKKYMEENCNFQASDSQYGAQFKKWGFRKNLKESDWKYVHTKFKQRTIDSRGPSAVFHNGILIPQKKVEKEISRHVPLSYQYAPGPLPPSPGDVTVCTPPSSCEAFLVDNADCLIPIKRKHLEGPLQDSLRFKRQYSVPKEALAMLDIATVPYQTQQTSLIAGPQVRPRAINLDGLPYFQFQDVMRSQAVIDGFRTLMNIEDGLVENFWSPPTTTYSHGQMLLADTHEPTLYLASDDSLDSLISCSPTQSSQVKLYKSFATDILYTRTYLNWDVGQVLIYTKNELPKFLANIPQKEGELEANIDLLLGPPTIEAARYVVEIGVYLSSNNLDSQHKLIDWMIQIIPWPILGPLLSNKLPTIQAFAEKVLDTAVRIGDIAIVRSLLESPTLRAHAQSSTFLLTKAVGSSNAEIVSLLLKAGANPNNSNIRPLSEARTVDIAQMLIEAHADVNAISYNSIWIGPALLEVVNRGDVAVARYLISVGAGVNVTGYRHIHHKQIFTPLVVATYGGQIELVQLLLKEGADVNAVSWTPPLAPYRKGRDGRDATALQTAAALGHLEIVRVLLEAGADSNFPACRRNGQTALQAATATGNIEMVELLLASGADVNARSTNDIQFPRNSLLTAVEMNNVRLVEVLLAAGADVNAPAFGYFGSTLLEAAKAQVNCTRVFEILQKAGARETQVANDCHCRIQLRDAVWKGDFGRVTALIEIGVPIDMEIIKDGTPPETDDGTILHWALNFGCKIANVELFQLLVSNVKDINAQNENPDSKPILHQAIEMRNIKLVEILIEAGADINANHPTYATPLILAAYLEHLDMVLLLLSKGADINIMVETSDSKQPYGATALQASLFLQTANDNCQTFYLLLERGAAINAPIKGSEGFTELVYAVRRGNMKDVQCLLRRGADVNAPPAKRHGRTALQEAALLEPANLDLVRLLLENGADINGPAATSYGLTALQAAVRQGHFQIALFLLEAGADVNASGSTKDETALCVAAYWSRLDLVHLLLKAGADKHLPLKERYTSAAEIARLRGHIVIAELLETWKRSEEMRSVRGHRASTSKDISGVIELD